MLSRLMLPIAALLALGGCQSLHPPPPVAVEVRDAETKQPIEGARVRMWHQAVHSVATTGTTGADGVARIAEPPAGDTPILYEVGANGYLARETDHPAERTAAGVVFELFAEPRPALELVVPNSFRGVIRMKIHVQDDLAYPAGKRVFPYSVPASGEVDVALPPIFGRGATPEIRTRFADGTAIPRDAKGFEVGCRWLKADPENGYIFVIGTQWEGDTVRREIQKAGKAR
jgi:hypothetical protein